MYIITGATGNTGRAAALQLLSEGKEVRAIARNHEKLKELADHGAEVMAGDVKDREFVVRAFAGGKVAYCMIPPDPKSENFRKEQKQIAQNYVDAVVENHLTHVVLLSSIGAHLRNGAGIVDGLGEMEEMFSHLHNVNVLNLRPTYFMENTLGQISTIKNMGIMGSPVKGDMAFPIVASKDIGVVLGKRLSDLSFKGNTVEYVLGQRDVSYNEIASVFGREIGKPDLKYVEFPYEDAEKAMVQSGYISEDVARLYTGLSQSLNNGTALSDVKRNASNTTPTKIEDFAKVFASVYNSQHA